MEALQGNGLLLDVYAWTMLIDVWCRQGELKRAMDAVDGMHAKGVLPNVVTYTAVIKGYLPFATDPKVLASILEVLEKMKRAGVHPDVNTFVAIFDACGLAGDLACGKRMFRDMMSCGTPLNGEVYISLLKLCASVGVDQGEFLIHSLTSLLALCERPSSASSAQQTTQ